MNQFVNAQIQGSYTGNQILVSLQPLLVVPAGQMVEWFNTPEWKAVVQLFIIIQTILSHSAEFSSYKSKEEKICNTSEAEWNTKHSHYGYVQERIEMSF